MHQDASRDVRNRTSWRANNTPCGRWLSRGSLGFQGISGISGDLWGTRDRCGTGWDRLRGGWLRGGWLHGGRRYVVAVERSGTGAVRGTAALRYSALGAPVWDGIYLFSRRLWPCLPRCLAVWRIRILPSSRDLQAMCRCGGRRVWGCWWWLWWLRLQGFCRRCLSRRSGARRRRSGRGGNGGSRLGSRVPVQVRRGEVFLRSGLLRPGSCDRVLATGALATRGMPLGPKRSRYNGTGGCRAFAPERDARPEKGSLRRCMR